MKLKLFASTLIAAALLAVPAADAWAKKPKHHAAQVKHTPAKHASKTKPGAKHHGTSKATKHHKKHV